MNAWKHPLIAAVLAVTACAPAPPAESDGGPPSAALRVCLGANDPPRSRRAGRQGAHGLDVDVARLAAANLDRRLQIVWLREQPQTDLESTDADYGPLAGGQCDIQLSVPGAAIAELPALELGKPYYGAAFELIPPGAELSWGQPHAGSVAVGANNVAHLALNAAGLPWTIRANSAGVAAAVSDGTVTAGLVWGPDLALLDVRHNADHEPPAVLRWNLHTAARRGDPLLADLDQVFSATASRIQELLAKHRLPPRAPFTSVHNAAALAALKAR